MTDRNDLVPEDLMPAQRTQWVTPKISLMGAGETEGNKTGGRRSYEGTYATGKKFETWSILTDFTSNPATPTKTSHRKGSAKTLFY